MDLKYRPSDIQIKIYLLCMKNHMKKWKIEHKKKYKNCMNLFPYSKFYNKCPINDPIYAMPFWNRNREIKISISVNNILHTSNWLWVHTKQNYYYIKP